MTLGVLLALVANATVGSPATLKLAMPGLRTVDVDAERASFYSEHLALQMKRAGIEVLTEREIGALLGMERQKQLLGCSDEATACMVEMANAMGTDGVVLGDVARVGKSVQVNLKVVSAHEGKTLAVFSERADSDEGTVDALTRGAVQLSRDVRAALGLPALELVAPPSSSAQGPTRFWWAPVAVGGVSLAVGAIFLVRAGDASSYIRGATKDDPILSSDAERAGLDGTTAQTIGGVCVGVGVALVAAGGVMAVMHLTHGPAVAVVPTASGASIAVAGTWP